MNAIGTRVLRTLASALLCGAVGVFVLGCPENTPSQGMSGTLPLMGTNVLLKDANGFVLGHVTETTADGVIVVTSKNYFVSIDWNGAVKDGVCWYTGPQGTGALFYIAPSNHRLFGFATSINGVHYVAANVDSAGFAVPDASITSFQSYYSGAGKVVDSAGAVPSDHAAYVLKPARLEDLGMPSAIAAPEQFVFQ